MWQPCWRATGRNMSVSWWGWSPLRLQLSLAGILIFCVCLQPPCTLQVEAAPEPFFFSFCGYIKAILSFHDVREEANRIKLNSCFWLFQCMLKGSIWVLGCSLLKDQYLPGSMVSHSVLDEKIVGHWLCVHRICKYLPLCLSEEMKLSLRSPRRL